MAAIVHDIVGLQHVSMAIFKALCDRAPILVLGGGGPMDVTRRRPWIDWIHTALVQGNQVRDYVKLDDHPASVSAIPEAILRAWRVARTEPQGPVYVCLGRMQHHLGLGHREHRDRTVGTRLAGPKLHILAGCADVYGGIWSHHSDSHRVSPSRTCPLSSRHRPCRLRQPSRPPMLRPLPVRGLAPHKQRHRKASEHVGQ
jgi:hypothetical protein